MKRFPLLWTSVIGLVGCGSPSGHRPTAPASATETPAPNPGQRPAPDVESVCAALGEKSRAVLEGLATHASASYRERVLPELGPGCAGEPGRRAGGAWALVADEGAVLEPRQAGQVDLEWGSSNLVPGSVTLKAALAWVGPEGDVRRLPLDMLEIGETMHTYRIDRLHDFNRDGRDEIVLRRSIVAPEGPYASSNLEVYRLGEEGTPALWDTGAFEVLQDIDGDGVLDLVSPRAFAAGEWWPDGDLQTPPSLPGVRRVLPGFGVTDADAAVAAFYRKRCPAKITAADLKPGAAVPLLVEQAACAWLWGEGGPALDAALARAVAPADTALDGPGLRGPWSEEGARPPVNLDGPP
jgi:hypothetical protein